MSAKAQALAKVTSLPEKFPDGWRYVPETLPSGEVIYHEVAEARVRELEKSIQKLEANQ